MQTKQRLIWELEESNRIMNKDSQQIFELGAKLNKLKLVLEEIVELSEGSPSSYRDFGDIAREAIKNL